MSTKKIIKSPEEQLFLELTKSCMLARKMAEKALRPLGVTIAEYNLLRIIRNTPKITLSEIGDRILATAPSVTQTIDRIQAKGLVHRKRDNTDKRKMHMTLTPQGRTIVIEGMRSIDRSTRTLAVSKKELLSLSTQLADLSSSLTSFLLSHGN